MSEQRDLRRRLGPNHWPWKGLYPTQEEIVEFAGRLGREAAQEGDDPFAQTPGATREDCEIRARHARPEQRVGLGNGFKPKPRKVDLNPLERRWLEREGYVWARVEHPNAHGAVTVDLWGCWDYLAARADLPGVLLVQVTTLANLSARRRKILAAPETPVLLAAGNRLQIHAWSQPEGPGTRWAVRVEEIAG